MKTLTILQILFWSIVETLLISLTLLLILSLTFGIESINKSHGDFDAGDPFEVPLYTDAHNLKPGP